MRYLILLALPLLGACAADRDPASLFGPDAAGQVVVDGVLLVDQPLGDVFIRRTLAPGQEYTAELAAVRDAQVSITSGSTTWVYSHDPDSSGRYLPPPGAPLVQPQTTYELVARVDDQVVRAQTTTPGRLRLQEAVVLDAASLAQERGLRLFAEAGPQAFKAPENQIPFRSGLIELRVTPEPGVRYQLALRNLEADSRFLIDEGFLEEDDAEDFDREGSSPPLEAADGRVRVPWFAIAFEGRHLLRLYSLDRNWYDYARTTDQGGFFGGLVGDGFERPLFRVEGGLGLFGSAAVDSLGFTVLPRP